MVRGSIEARSNGSLRVHVSITENGIRKQITRTAHSPQEAERIRTKLMHQKYEGTLSEQPKGTLDQFLDRWLSDYVESNLSPSTYQGYQYIIRSHITPAIGSMALKNLHPEHLQRYYADKLKAGLSSTSVRHHHTLLHKAFKQAVQWGLMQRNPADAVSAPRLRKAEMHTLSESDVDSVLRSSYPEYYPLFYLALFTGLRRGELLALRWSDVNLPMAEISVSRSVVPLKGGKYLIKESKTPKSRRTVALSPSTCQVLLEHMEKQMANYSRLDIKFKNNTLVFCHLDNSPLKGNTVWCAWHKLMKRLGINDIRFHDTRHTMATMMLAAGVHPKIVQERLGHSSIAITLDTYSHVAPGLQHTAANKMDDILLKKVTNSLP